MIENNPVEPTEQQGALGLAFQGQADVIELAAGQENTDGIEAEQPRVAQQPRQAPVAHLAVAGQSFEQSGRGAIPRDHIDRELNRLRCRPGSEGLTSEQLAVAVGNQQQFQGAVHGVLPA